jgi:hypothetical protein
VEEEEPDKQTELVKDAVEHKEGEEEAEKDELGDDVWHPLAVAHPDPLSVADTQ